MKEIKLCDMCQNIASVSLGDKLIIMIKSANDDRERLGYLCDHCFRDLFIDRTIGFFEFRAKVYEVVSR